MKVAKNRVVSINFTLTSDQGEHLDASVEGTPLIYLHGGAGIVPGLERELEGKDIGETFSVTIEPADGFGESSPELMQTVPMTLFPDPSQIKPGVQIQGSGADGGADKNFVVREVTDGFVVLDGNHPLAGLTLCFEGSVHEVRDATDEEIRQGSPL